MPGNSAEIARLVTRARRGDSGAFGELYHVFVPDVRAYCLRRIHDPHRAEELAQDVFERAWKGVRRLPAGDRFWPWLQVIAFHLCVDEVRHQKSVRLEPLGSKVAAQLQHPGNTESEALALRVNEELRADLRTALAHLRPRSASIVLQRLEDGVSYEEIAARYTTSIPSIRNTAWKAVGALRTLLRNAGWPERRLGLLVPTALFRRVQRRLTERAVSLRFELIGEATVQQLVFALSSLVVALAASASSVALETFPSEAAGGTLVASAASVTTGAGAPATAPALRRPPAPSSTAGPPEGSVDLQVDAEKRDRAPAPTHAYGAVEIRGPDGSTLYRNETELNCEVDSRSLPPGGPVTAYC